MPFIFIDRRKAGRGKSSPNRQKLIKRIKSFIKTSLPQNIGQGGVSGAKAKPGSHVKVANDALEEPRLAYANDGTHTAIIIGNDQYQRGDIIDIPDESESPGAGQGGDGEDDFIVNIARDEFLELFFEDCELPNLVNERYTEKLENHAEPAGFSTSGNPSQLSIIRTYKQTIGRRRALTSPLNDEIKALNIELQELEDGVKSAEAEIRIAEIKDRLTVLHRKVNSLRGFDNIDLRYRKKESKPLKTVDAVLIMVMDISGSMDESKKTIARRWFALLYAFIKQRYSNTELVFIAHHDEAFEMSEDDFFSTRINGGTSVSPALKMVNQIIKERYDPNQTNIYVSHASDGDNWESDDQLVLEEMIGHGRLLDKIQLFSYVEVGKQQGSFSMGRVTANRDTNLWQTYDIAQDEVGTKKLTMAIIETADDCYSVFSKIFKKKRG